jgi:hypothetical protein
MVQIIVSLTTSPKRLPLLEKTLDSIVQQNIKPNKIYVNLPLVFERTQEVYPDPNLIYQYKPEYKDIVVWNRNCQDIGPLTKLQGVLEEIDETQDVWIITIDDDIVYLPYTIEVYAMTVQRLEGGNRPKTSAYGLAGFIWHQNQLIPQHENSMVHILEGYGSVCYHRSFFPNKSWKTYVQKCMEDNHCKFSDDLLISNWLSLTNKRRTIVSTPWNNRRVMWANNCILEYGNGPDALHNGGDLKLETCNNNVTRYMKSKEFLKSVHLLAKEFSHLM